jgi:hypothetical protein
MEYEKKYEVKPNSGSLHASLQKLSEKSSDFFGSISLDKEYVKLLLEQSDEETITVKLYGWKSESKAGKKYLSLLVNTYTTDAAPKSTEKDPWE